MKPKLNLYEKFEQRRKIYDDMKQTLNDSKKLEQYINQLEELE